MDKIFFKKCKVWWWGGYYVPVRNNINFHIEYMHLSDKQKELYELQFGENIIYQNEFNKWYIESLRQN